MSYTKRNNVADVGIRPFLVIYQVRVRKAGVPEGQWTICLYTLYLGTIFILYVSSFDSTPQLPQRLTIPLSISAFEVSSGALSSELEQGMEKDLSSVLRHGVSTLLRSPVESLHADLGKSLQITASRLSLSSSLVTSSSFLTLVATSVTRREIDTLSPLVLKLNSMPQTESSLPRRTKKARRRLEALEEASMRSVIGGVGKRRQRRELFSRVESRL